MLRTAPHNQGMLRLDPAHPPLWRSATTLQFGPDAVAVIEDPAPWQQRLIRELEHGIPDAALDPIAVAFGAPERAAGSFIRRIARALVPPAPTPFAVALQTPDGFPRRDADRVTDSLASSGLQVSQVTWFGAPNERLEGANPVIVLAHHLVDPRRVSALMAWDVPHIPLVFTGSAAEVGPYVLPGRTPCLACICAHRRDADAAWPALAAQLLGRRAPAVGDALTVEAAFATAKMLIEAERHPQRARGHSLTLREDSLHRSMRAHLPHAECRCRSLGGTGTAGALEFPATTTASVFAQPA